MAALTVDFRKHSGPTPADDIGAQIITDCGNFTLDFKQHGFCASPLFLQTLGPWFPNEMQNLLSFNPFCFFFFFIVNGWQILLHCLVMFSCLHLTSARIQVARSSASVNSKFRLLHFDWLFQTFRHWRALLNRCTEPEHARLIRILNEVGRVSRAIRLGWWKDIHTFTTIHFYIYYAKGRPTLYSGPPGKLPVLQMASPPLHTPMNWCDCNTENM